MVLENRLCENVLFRNVMLSVFSFIDEEVKIHIMLDHSYIQVFVNINTNLYAHCILERIRNFSL